jgi:hypothetical protein
MREAAGRLRCESGIMLTANAFDVGCQSQADLRNSSAHTLASSPLNAETDSSTCRRIVAGAGALAVENNVTVGTDTVAVSIGEHPHG